MLGWTSSDATIAAFDQNKISELFDKKPIGKS